MPCPTLCTFLPVPFIPPCPCCCSLPSHPPGDSSARESSLNSVAEGWLGMPPHPGTPDPLPPPTAALPPRCFPPLGSRIRRGRLSPLPANSFPVRSPCSLPVTPGACPRLPLLPAPAARGQHRPAPADEFAGTQRPPGPAPEPAGLGRGQRPGTPPRRQANSAALPAAYPSPSCEGCGPPEGSLLPGPC